MNTAINTDYWVLLAVHATNTTTTSTAISLRSDQMTIPAKFLNRHRQFQCLTMIRCFLKGVTLYCVWQKSTDFNCMRQNQRASLWWGSVSNRRCPYGMHRGTDSGELAYCAAEKWDLGSASMRTLLGCMVNLYRSLLIDNCATQLANRKPSRGRPLPKPVFMSKRWHSLLLYGGLVQGGIPFRYLDTAPGLLLCGKASSTAPYFYKGRGAENGIGHMV